MVQETVVSQARAFNRLIKISRPAKYILFNSYLLLIKLGSFDDYKPVGPTLEKIPKSVANLLALLLATPILN